jgi:dihydroorotase
MAIGQHLISESGTVIVDVPHLCVSPGWVDMHAYFFDPGHEQKETVSTGLDAAAHGGYTHVCVMPYPDQHITSKAQIEYLLHKAKGHVSNILPIGALTAGVQGKDIADVYDLYLSGAVGFSDGTMPIPSAGMLERGMLYLKAFEGLMMLHAEEHSIAVNGQMHEGLTSTQLGLASMPAHAEELAVSTALYLHEYTESRLHILDVSIAASVDLLRAAKAESTLLTASVNAHHLLLTDTAVGDYDTLAKVNPPLRSQTDIAALIAGIKQGVIDTITSQHTPHELDAKRVEFDRAAFGMIGLETCYAIANTVLRDKLDVTEIVALFATRARQILQLPDASIVVGADADMTLFDPTREWIFESKDIRSLAHNTPFLGTRFTGKPIGIINNNKMYLNDGKL